MMTKAQCKQWLKWWKDRPTEEEVIFLKIMAWPCAVIIIGFGCIAAWFYQALQ